ncbi:sorting nexin-14-like isoform X2 [Centruroides vittatus]|uniref:sorting nexin-14-like isoform X2 n=1 Tax=Centruroides vittatus TaxID=120091 RepID=UPI00350ECEAE
MAASLTSTEPGLTLYWALFTDKLCCLTTICVIFVTLGTFIIFDILSAVTVLISYLIGCLGVTFILWLRERKLPDIFFLPKKSKQLVNVFNIPQQCTVCGNMKCKRHRSDLNVYVLKPWTDLMIPESVNEALEEILSLTLKEHIYSWYKSISSDEYFVQELRVSLRFLISSLLIRILQVDNVDLITEKIANAVLKHVDCYLYVKDQSKPHELLQEKVLNYYGSNLHIALQNRKTEVHYLRNLIELLLPYCLPKKFLFCRSSLFLVREIFCTLVLLPVMDIIADPDIINHLLLIFFDKTPMKEYPDSSDKPVEILSNFAIIKAPHKKPILQTDLQTILSTQNLLFSFMQFLKEEASVNVLQFCLSVDDFNARILNPDLSLEEMKELQKEAQNMYNTYFAPNAVDKIKFSDDIVEQIRNVIYGPVEDIVKLRTTSPLFRAYDHAYNLLENTFCPLFHQSDRYYNLLCGERWSSTVTKNLNRSTKKGNEPSTIAKLSHKIKGVFVPNIDDGRLFEEEAGTDLAMAMLSEASLSTELSEESFKFSDDPRLKTLSAWRVSIPRVETLMDHNCKYYDAFYVEVQRIDVREEDDPDDFHWTVKRQYHEFYVLEAKLREFHGELPDIQLPPKRSLGSKGKQFLESRRPAFEKFLQDLLSLPTLQGSELLYRFLKSRIEFKPGFLPEINLGKMIKTVPMKLIKEKGQHLEPFLQTFVVSTEAAKPKPSKHDWKEICDVPESSLLGKLRNPLYEKNSIHANINFQRLSNTIILEGIYDYVLFVAVKIYNVPKWVVQILTTFDIIIRHTFQGFVKWYLEKKLRQALKPQRIVELIHLLRDALFFNQDTPRTEAQKKERLSLVFQEANEFFPEWLVRILGPSQYKEGNKTIISLVQHPLLNKQLTYILLDIIVLELFPELKQTTES